MILTEKDILVAMKKANMEVVLPSDSCPIQTSTSYYDYAKSHGHNLLIDKLLKKDKQED